MKTCIFCDKKRPYNYRKLKWQGVRYGKGVSYWACAWCLITKDLQGYAWHLEIVRKGSE